MRPPSSESFVRSAQEGFRHQQKLLSMRTPSLLFASLAVLFLSSQVQATILTVHNDPLYSAQYSTLSAAYTAASPFDTLLVHGSATSYGSLAMSKPLTIIGPGHDPTVGPRAAISVLQLFNGSDSTTMEGLTVNQLIINSTHCAVRSCLIPIYTTIQSGGDDALITGCVFSEAYLDVDQNAANVEVRNCFFSESGTATQFRTGSATTLVHHCAFVRSSTSTSTGNRVFAASSYFPVFADNVFYTATIASFNPNDCPNFSFQSNLSYSTEGAVISMGPNNLDNVAPTWSVGGYPTFNYGYDYTMLSGTPSTGASDGGQVGVMGGPYPLKNNGLPSLIPRVISTQLETPYVPVGGTIDVNFQAVQGQP